MGKEGFMKKEHIGKIIRNSISEYGEKTAMRYKDGELWKSISYKEAGEKIENTSKGLLEYGVKEGEMVGIFSENRPEWAIVDFGILSIRGVSVPIYATNTAKQAEYIVNDAQLTHVFVSTQVHYDKINSFFKNTDSLKKIIVFDESVRIEGDNAIYYKDFLEIGKNANTEDELKKRLDSATTEDLATLIYTSGTTGNPKGVMLNHTNFASQFVAVEEKFNVGTDDKSLCFLPLSHAYERTWSFYVYRSGAENIYLADPKDIIDTMQEVRPSAMVSVPRLYEKIYSTVYDRIEKAGGIKKKLFNWAVKNGLKYSNKKIRDKKMVGPYLGFKHRLADKLILSKMRDVVGGNKNFFSAGGAPLSQDIEEFFFAAGLLICQGYGLTETAPMITFNCPSAFKFGTVGKVIPNCEAKIGDDGEILARGPNIMQGYYNNPESTKETIVDGWLKTGDVGVIDNEGFIRITDRIKDLIITSQGKNVAPQHIETNVGMDHYIEQLAVIGDQKKYISALIVPNFEALEEYAKDNNISFSSRKDLINNQEIKEFYSKRIDDQSSELANYEKIKRFTLMENEFTQDGGELTPTMKIKRKVVAEKYNDQISSMYGE